MTGLAESKRLRDAKKAIKRRLTMLRLRAISSRCRVGIEMPFGRIDCRVVPRPVYSRRDGVPHVAGLAIFRLNGRQRGRRVLEELMLKEEAKGWVQA